MAKKKRRKSSRRAVVKRAYEKAKREYHRLGRKLRRTR